jgi:hypothetical protein
LVCLLGSTPPANGEPNAGHHILTMCWGGFEPRRFTIPEVARKYSWRVFINTGVKSPGDIYPKLDGPAPGPDWTIVLESRSLVCLVARDKI